MKVDPFSPSIDVSPDELLWIYHSIRQLIKPGQDPYLITDISRIQAIYHSTKNWLAYETEQGPITAPYQVIADFTRISAMENWGDVKYTPPFEFPRILLDHRAAMESAFENAGWLGKGNQPKVRVQDCYVDSQLHLKVQHAGYVDQVGTNLTLDYPLDKSLGNVNCVRDWDLAHADLPGSLPAFERSQLANTIGVAVGVTARDARGTMRIIKRLRTKKVAVYRNLWHVPLSFALAWPPELDVKKSMSVSELVHRDYGHELAEELPGVEPAVFGPLQFLAFCRDMVRGGKPQFFFEIRSRLSVEELRRQVSPDNAEYRKSLEVMTNRTPDISSELLAFAILIAQQENP